jgi:alkylation response protein AidB-like acyl-CoA dehydrogenase
VDFELTEEQTWLRESVDELLAREPEERLWASLVDFGALQVGGDEGLGAIELALVARAVGERLAAVPFADTAAVRYAVDIGDAAAAACLSEPGRSYVPTEPAATLEDGRLVAEKSHVGFASAVDVYAVSAASPEGPVLALVPAAAATVVAEPTLDPTIQPALLRFDAVEPERVVSERGVVESVAAVGAVLVSAEAVGAAAKLLELARAYATQRRQFGHTIGSFQAIRHLLADMYVNVESSWSSVLYAAASLDEHEPDSLRTTSIAKAYAARATLEVAHGAMQVFGGIAFTAEHEAHRYLRRIVARGSQFGTARDHERILGRALRQQVEAPV